MLKLIDFMNFIRVNEPEISNSLTLMDAFYTGCEIAEKVSSTSLEPGVCALSDYRHHLCKSISSQLPFRDVAGAFNWSLKISVFLAGCNVIDENQVDPYAANIIWGVHDLSAPHQEVALLDGLQNVNSLEQDDFLKFFREKPSMYVESTEFLRIFYFLRGYTYFRKIFIKEDKWVCFMSKLYADAASAPVDEKRTYVVNNSYIDRPISVLNTDPVVARFLLHSTDEEATTKFWLEWDTFNTSDV